MSTLTLIGAVAILSAAIATPVRAQQVISEPGYCAFFYPYANCQNKGPGNPYTPIPTTSAGPLKMTGGGPAIRRSALPENGLGHTVPIPLRCACSNDND
jgi:hypothetical protein